MEMDLPVIAGVISTTMFALSALPMLRKAFRTKDLRSYSLGDILFSNVGNVVYSVYVFNLPPGPIWLLHLLDLIAASLLLIWYLRYEWRRENRGRIRMDDTPSERLSAATPRLHVVVDEL